MNEKQEIVIYKSKNGLVNVDVNFDGENVWLNRLQMSQLFGRDIKTIGKHINNALKEELNDFSVVAKFATTATDNKTYKVEHYNLDMILSVGYRVKSDEGVRFRIWANKVLKEYLLNGAAINQKRLKQLNKTLEIISRSIIPEVSGIANILQNFSNGLDLLDKYDHQRLEKPRIRGNTDWQLSYNEARSFIDSMKSGNESSLFGREKDESFKSSIGVIYQTFDGQELYPSIQEKAANLLYLVVKNHSFSDGNKRIAAALFVYFLEKNNALKDKNGKLLIDNNALAAMTLMLALSEPQEKEIMCNLVMNFLKG